MKTTRRLCFASLCAGALALTNVAIVRAQTAPAPLASTVKLSLPSGLFTGTPSLQLSGAGAGETIRYVIAEPNPNGATADEPAAASAEYSAPLLLDRAMVLRSAVFTADGSRRGPVVSAHFVPLETATPARLDNFGTGLPIVVFDGHGMGELEKDDVDHAAWLYGFAPSADGIARLSNEPDYAMPITMSVRGSSSATFGKKSYKFDLRDGDGKKTAVPLFGLPSFAEWTIIGPFLFDNSHLRNVIGYALSNEIGRWAPRTQLAEVYFNYNGGPLDASDYVGVYVLTDKLDVDPGRVSITSLAVEDLDATAITGGYFLRVDTPDPEKTFWTTKRGFATSTSSVLMVESPKTAKLAPAQAAYIQDYVQKFEDALHADRDGAWATRNYLEYIDRASWVDHHLLNTFFKNVDAFWKSSYFTKDRGGKIVAGPIWDLDRSMDSYDGRDDRWDTWDAEAHRTEGYAIRYWHFEWWGVLAQDPDFRQEWIDRWQSLRRSTLSDSNLSALINYLSGRIGLEAAARDANKWSPNVGRRGGFAGEIAHLKGWLMQRANWIDQQFVSAPRLTTSGDQFVLTPTAGNQVLYTLDGIDPRGSEGRPVASAISTSAPVLLPRTADVKARSYRPEMEAFPGTPWSGLAGGFAPAAPGAEGDSRLVNLSARATVQSGDNVLIAGIVVASPTPKSFLVRAAGPVLSTLGVADALPNPLLRIFRADGSEIARNESWSTGPDAETLPTTAATLGATPFPAGSNDAALLIQLAAGTHTLSISSASTLTGGGLVEVYETDNNGSAKNLSSRARVTAASPLISGFVINGSRAKRVLVRAIGPTLLNQGVSGALNDPTLTVYSGTTAIATNDDWMRQPNSSAIDLAARRLGAFGLPEESKDAALLLTLDPGVYSAVVRGADGTDGVSLIEIYDAH